jgi:hypothetical protein
MVVCSGEKGCFDNSFLATHTAFFNSSPSTTFGYISSRLGLQFAAIGLLFAVLLTIAILTFDGGSV